MLRPEFVHLRVRSAYSLLDGAMPVKRIAEIAAAQKAPALAICDLDNLFGALEVSEALSEKGIQPILGCTLSVQARPPGPGGVGGADGVIALLAQNETGWRNLMALASAPYLGPAAAQRCVPLDLLARHSDGMIALTGGHGGLLNALLASGRMGEAETALDVLADAFGDRLYIELQRHGRADEARVEPLLTALAYARGLPLVATNDVRFETQGRHGAHQVLSCIAAGLTIGAERANASTPEQYFKSAEEMGALFVDCPEALASTVEIAQRCAWRAPVRAPILPRFTGAQGRDEAEELAVQAREGLKARFAKHPPAADESVYWERLEHEIAVITAMQFPGYFLIVSDFIKWAKAQGIPVGPGRGSGAGSLVAYALTITDLDPLRFGLLFERFLNPERVSMPDFDIDFCQERRGEVIAYVQQKYGADRVAQIITFGTLQARAVVRDVGRVLQLGFNEVDRLAKLIPANPANPVRLAEAIAAEPRLQEARRSSDNVAALLDVALELEGLYRNASTHAAGVVIADRPLVELSPLYQDPRSELPATQFNMKWVELAGLVKFDFLGLKTLTVIDRALRLIAKSGVALDLDAVTYDDPATYRMMASGATMGVFQLESQGMRDTLRKMQPDSLEDIIALISLYRPGPMKNIDLYCAVKQGRQRPDYLHPLLEPVLKETFGIIIYQEQVMQIAQILSGYSLGEADLLRRAMGKKKKEEMEAQKARFISGAAANGVDKALADRIFELVNEFAGYGFNKSHAAAYAVIAYQTGYLKANYPAEFMAASMSLDIDDTDKLAAFVQESRKIGLTILPPDVNRSLADFDVQEGAVRYGLGAVRNIGLAAMEQVVAAREAEGPFRDLEDFAGRIDPKSVNKRLYENLARAGALDPLEPNRARALAAADAVLGAAQRAGEDRAQAQASLFGDAAEPARLSIPQAAPWSAQERLDQEFAALGVYLSGHPLEDLRGALERKQVVFAEDLASRVGPEGAAVFRMAGIVRLRKERPAQSGGKFAWVTLSDPSGEFEVMVMPETLVVARDLLDPGKGVLLRVKARTREGDLKLTADGIEPLADADLSGCAGLKVLLDSPAAAAAVSRIGQQIRASGARAQGELRLVAPLAGGGQVEIVCPGRWPVDVAARRALKSAAGVAEVLEF